MNSIDDIRNACESAGFVLPTATRRIRTTYRFGASTHRTLPALLRACKRTQCVACEHYVPEHLRTHRRMELTDDFMRDVRCGDVAAAAEAFEEYRLANFESWLEGCKAGARPDIREHEDEAPPKVKGGWWSMISFPCPTFVREQVDEKDDA